MFALVSNDRSDRRCARCREALDEVLVAGGAMGDREWGRFARALPLCTRRSERREYVFDRVVKKPWWVDPAQPVVAGVYAAKEGGRVTPAHREHLGLWRARGLPAPVLWTFGAATEVWRTQLRAQVAAVGWSPDALSFVAGPVVPGEFPDAAMGALVDGLDALA